jgi:hypothetical protein
MWPVSIPNNVLQMLQLSPPVVPILMCCTGGQPSRPAGRQAGQRLREGTHSPHDAAGGAHAGEVMLPPHALVVVASLGV